MLREWAVAGIADTVVEMRRRSEKRVAGTSTKPRSNLSAEYSLLGL